MVYRITCKLCGRRYIGETSRALHERMMEHFRAANAPSSYSSEAMAQHYSEFHRNIVAQLQLEIIDYAAKTVRRKITEALYIHREKPEINNKLECVNISKYLVL